MTVKTWLRRPPQRLTLRPQGSWHHSHCLIVCHCPNIKKKPEVFLEMKIKLTEQDYYFFLFCNYIPPSLKYCNLYHRHTQDCPALTGNARSRRCKNWFSHYMLNCTADSSHPRPSSTPAPPLPFLACSGLSSSVTAIPQLTLSSDTPTKVLYPPVIKLSGSLTFTLKSCHCSGSFASASVFKDGRGGTTRWVQQWCEHVDMLLSTGVKVGGFLSALGFIIKY